MKIQVLPLIIVFAYLIGMLLIGYITKKYFVKTSTDFMLGGRRLGVFFVAASLAANNVGGGSTTGVAAKAFSGWGLSAGWYVLAASIGIIPLAYFCLLYTSDAADDLLCVDLGGRRIIKKKKNKHKNKIT